MNAVPLRAQYVVTALFIAVGAIAAIVVAATFVIVAARDDDGPDVAAEAPATPTLAPTAAPTAAPPPRLAGVPASAAEVTTNVAFGSLDPSSPDARAFFNLRCEGRLLRVATTRETIYADIPCERYWLPDDVVRPYLGQPVRIEIGRAGTMILRVTAQAGTMRFEARAVWLEER